MLSYEEHTMLDEFRAASRAKYGVLLSYGEEAMCIVQSRTCKRPLIDILKELVELKSECFKSLTAELRT